MGKKRVTSGFNDEDKPPNHPPDHHHHHHHHHRHHNHHKPKKIKPETKLLHTLNSNLKKLAKYRSRNLISLSSPPPRANISTECNKNHRGHLSSWLKHDDKGDWFMDFDIDHDDIHLEYGGDMGVIEFGQELLLKTTSFLGSENINEDLFGGDFVFAPDLHASHNMVVVFGEYGFWYGSYIPDPVLNLDDGDKGRHIYDMLKLSSQEDMINEFLKTDAVICNLFSLSPCLGSALFFIPPSLTCCGRLRDQQPCLCEYTQGRYLGAGARRVAQACGVVINPCYIEIK